jgi:NADH-quinone oxidoreductase subunit J
MTQYFFYFLSTLCVVFALLVVLSRNPVHSVLYLILCFFAIAGHYILLNAQFLAAVHIIVYAGAIMVLFLFVLMLMNLNKDSEPTKSWQGRIAATLASGLLLLVLTASIRSADSLPSASQTDNSIGLLSNLGKTLYNQYLLPFEVSALLFLVAMVGAVMLGKREENS